MIIPDKKKAATVIIAQMHDPQRREEKEEDGDEEECAALGQEVLDALASKDGMAVYEALAAVFHKADAEPHVEGEHEEEEEEEY